MITDERHMIVERAAAAREQAQQLRDRTMEAHETCRAVLGTHLTRLTVKVDSGAGTVVDPPRVARLGAVLGRDPVIEDAKRLLCERHGLTGAEAFELLRRVSQHRNRKLRDVARELVSSAA